MRKRYRSFLLLLVPAFFLLSGWTYLAGQEKRPSAGNGTRWSDPATWPDRKVPGKGDAVTIAKAIKAGLFLAGVEIRAAL